MRIQETTLGVLFIVVASVMFAGIYYYGALLQPLSGVHIYGWRLLLTLPFLTLLVLLLGKGPEIRAIFQRLRHEYRLWLLLPVSAFLLSIQLWLFMWAPINGYALDVSLGYFLLPLVLVLTGRLVFHESLSALQLWVCLIAGLGVINELFFAPRISWPTFVVAIGYTLYFSLRRLLHTNSLGGMWFDMLLSLPVACWFILESLNILLPALPDKPSLMPLIAGLGLLSAVALAMMILASQKLAMGLYGLLSYCEPALLILVALFLGERIQTEQWMTYICIWIAVFLLFLDGLRKIRKQRWQQNA